MSHGATSVCYQCLCMYPGTLLCLKAGHLTAVQAGAGSCLVQSLYGRDKAHCWGISSELANPSPALHQAWLQQLALRPTWATHNIVCTDTGDAMCSAQLGKQLLLVPRTLIKDEETSCEHGFPASRLAVLLAQ